MGRPKKEVAETVTKVKLPTTTPISIPAKKGKKPIPDSEKYPHCERCDALIYSQPLKIDTNILTGCADYKRSTPQYVKLCSVCSKELSDIVEGWLLEGGCKTKYQIKQEARSEEN